MLPGDGPRSRRRALSGEPGEAVKDYLASTEGVFAGEWRHPEPVKGRTQVLRAFLCDANGVPNDNPDCGTSFGVVIEFSVGERLRELCLGMAVCNQYQVPVFSTSPSDVGVGVPLEPGRYHTKVILPPGFLMPKGFSLIISLYNRWQGFDSHSHIMPFQVQAVASVATATPTGRLGDVFTECAWSAMVKLPEEPGGRTPS